MGRPLNKKYFGNRNIGAAGTTDDGIGGGAVATFTVATGGAYINRPTANVVAVVPGGVMSTGTTTLEVASAVVTVGGGAGADNYVTGDILTVTTASGVATFSVTADVDGVVTAVTPLARGTFAGVLATGAQATTTDSVAGLGCTLTLTYRVVSIQVAIAGSGHAVGSTVNFGGGGGTGATATVATIAADTGAVGSATNQENAIIIRANVDGTTAIADIIRQVRARGYKVKTTVDGVGVCNLVADDTPAVGKAYMVATDDNGNTYFVTKLTARKASLYRKTQNGANAWLYANGASVKWALDSTNNCVRIENA